MTTAAAIALTASTTMAKIPRYTPAAATCFFSHSMIRKLKPQPLEEFEKVSNWQSDRQLKVTYAEYFQTGGSRDAAPDGAYKSISGKIIAFEYEIAQKSKKRYQDKIRKYVNCIRQNNFDSSPKFDHVHIICDKESVHKILLDFTVIYNNYFTVEKSSDFSRRFQKGVVSFANQLSSVEVIQ